MGLDIGRVPYIESNSREIPIAHFKDGLNKQVCIRWAYLVGLHIIAYCEQLNGWANFYLCFSSPISKWALAFRDNFIMIYYEQNTLLVLMLLFRANITSGCVHLKYETRTGMWHFSEINLLLCNCVYLLKYILIPSCDVVLHVWHGQVLLSCTAIRYTHWTCICVHTVYVLFQAMDKLYNKTHKKANASNEFDLLEDKYGPMHDYLLKLVSRV